MVFQQQAKAQAMQEAASTRRGLFLPLLPPFMKTFPAIGGKVCTVNYHSKLTFKETKDEVSPFSWVVYLVWNDWACVLVRRDGNHSGDKDQEEDEDWDWD